MHRCSNPMCVKLISTAYSTRYLVKQSRWYCSEKCLEEYKRDSEVFERAVDPFAQREHVTKKPQWAR